MMWNSCNNTTSGTTLVPVCAFSIFYGSSSSSSSLFSLNSSSFFTSSSSSSSSSFSFFSSESSNLFSSASSLCNSFSSSFLSCSFSLSSVSFETPYSSSSLSSSDSCDSSFPFYFSSGQSLFSSSFLPASQFLKSSTRLSFPSSSSFSSQGLSFSSFKSFCFSSLSSSSPFISSSVLKKKNPSIIAKDKDTMQGSEGRKDTEIYRVVDRVYISSVYGAIQKEKLESMKITHILSVGSNLPTPFKKCFVYMKIHINDTIDADLLAILPSCVDFMVNALNSSHSNSVLVHCYAGISRSCSVITAYLMKEFGMSLDTALKHMRWVRPKVNPNDGFIFQLKEYEKSIQKLSRMKSINISYNNSFPNYKSNLSHSNVIDGAKYIKFNKNNSNYVLLT